MSPVYQWLKKEQKYAKQSHNPTRKPNANKTTTKQQLHNKRTNR